MSRFNAEEFTRFSIPGHRTDSEDGHVGRAAPAAKRVATVGERRVAPIYRRQACRKVRLQDVRETIPRFVKRTRVLYFAGQREIPAIGVDDAGCRGSVGAREIHEMQAIVGAQSKVGDEKVVPGSQQLLARSKKVGASVDIREERDCAEKAGSVRGIRFDEKYTSAHLPLTRP